MASDPPRRGSADCPHDFIDERTPYRDDAGFVFTRACCLCGLHQESLIGTDELPRGQQLLGKVRLIIQAGAIEELEPVIEQLYLVMTADAWRVA